ncbi:MAG: C4-dicarboxylate transporter permease [Moraxellaceae bacterium]|jgi:TRAP-type C4-dicarboxylate transport system permease small subunit|nr:C4-dicarboxylate transporter permease [Moraxellaceae bacterium]
MREWLTRGLRVLHWLEDGLLVGLLLTMVGLAVLQIVLRNGFDGGFLWAESFLRVLVLWIGLAGAMAASREHRHISIDILGRFLPTPAAKVVAVFNALFTAGICAALAWYTFDFVKMEYEAPVMAFANVPTWVCESIMPIAFTVIALRYLLLAVLLPWRALPQGGGGHGLPFEGGAP